MSPPARPPVPVPSRPGLTPASPRPVAVALPLVADLQLLHITHNSMLARWAPAPGASGYMVLYAPLSQDQPAHEKEVRGGAGEGQG